jgi:glutamine---fructose-6-phosphate transaminase (isomerizing)
MAQSRYDGVDFYCRAFPCNDPKDKGVFAPMETGLKLLAQEIASTPTGLKNLLASLPEKLSILPDAASWEFIAEGSSAHAAAFLQPVLTAGLQAPVRVVSPEEVLDSFSSWGVSTPSVGCRVFISQSGKTASLLNLLAQTDLDHVETIAFVNDIESPLAKAVSYGIDLKAGPEKSIAATKSVSHTLAALYAFSQSKAGQLPLAIKELTTAASLLEDWLQSETEQTHFAAWVENMARGSNPAITLVGPSWLLPILKEGALKLREVLQLEATAYSYEGFHHGPKAVLSRALPPLVLYVYPEAYQSHIQRHLHLAPAMQNQGAIFSLGLGFDNAIALPKSEIPIITGLMTLLALQKLVWKWAEIFSINPNASNLSKSVSF